MEERRWREGLNIQELRWNGTSPGRPVPRQEIKPALRLDECTLLFAKANTLCSNTQW